MQSSVHRVVLFVIVGCVAAAIHFGVVKLLVDGAGIAPLLANVAGWLTAFCASFLGHYRLTFRVQGAPAMRAMRRFFALSATGFAINECAYAILLAWSGMAYDIALVIVLLAVAVLTYVLGRHWAFAGGDAH